MVNVVVVEAVEVAAEVNVVGSVVVEVAVAGDVVVVVKGVAENVVVEFAVVGGAGGVRYISAKHRGRGQEWRRRG